MKVLSFSLGELAANTYFLIKNGKLLIIDPADKADFILEEIQRRRLNLVGLLVTHGHFDHLMAVGEIQLSFNLPFYVNKKDLFLVKRLKETAAYYLNHLPPLMPIGYIKNLENKDLLEIKNFKLKIIKTPGHTPGSVCFYFEEDGLLFTGDTLFQNGVVGRTDFAYGDANKLKKSIQKLFSLPKETIIYPGHGEQDILGESLAHFLTSSPQQD